MKWNESLSWSWEKIVNSRTWRRSYTYFSWQTTIKTKWALRSDYVFSETRILKLIHDACFRYSNFLQDKNINRMMNINDNQVASLQLCTNQRALNMVDDIVHYDIWHQNHISYILKFGLYEYCMISENRIQIILNLPRIKKQIRFIFIIILRYHWL